MSDRRVKVVFEAEIANFKKGISDAAKETEKLAKSTDTAGKSVGERMQKINTVAAADQRAAKAAGLLYNAQGQLADANGKVLSSSQAAAHGVESFSEAVYLAGHDAEVASAKSVAAAEKQKAAWETLSPVILASSAAIVAGVGMAVTKYASFDKAMSSVQAATHETAGNMLQLREAAIEAGADTAFSAEEAAKGIEELAKAGVSTESVLSGGLKGALDLAAAGELSVGESAEIAASAMTQFKLSGDQIPHLADLLAAGAGKAQGSVHDMGEALNQAGLVASATGLSIEETTGGLAAFASAGLTGSDAGTSFKTMLQRLTPQSKEAQKQFDALGISAYDANGEFVGLANFAGQLQTKMADLTPEARNAAMSVMFGSDAVRASNVLYEQGAKGIQEWINQVNDAGYAAETAAIMQDNLAGDIEKLGGAFDTVFIKSGSGANDFLRDLAQSAEGLVDAIGQIPGPVLSTVTSIAGIAGVAGLAVGGFAKLAPAAIESWKAFKDLGNESSKMPGRLGKAAKAATIAAAAYTALATAATVASEARANLDKPVKASEIVNALTEITSNGEASAKALDKVFEGSVVTGGGTGFGSAPTAVNDLASAMDRLHDSSAFDNFNDFLGTWVPGVESGSEVVRKNLGEVDSALSTLASSGAFEQASAGFTMLRDATLESGGTMDDVKKYGAGYLETLRDIANGLGETVGEQDLLNWALTGTEPAAVSAARSAEQAANALEEVGVSASGAVESMEDFLDLLFATGMATMSSRDAAFAYEEQLRSIDDAVEEIKKGKLGKALNKAKDDFDKTTEAGKRANDEFQALAKSGMDEVRAMSEEGLGQDELQAKLTTTYDDLVKAGQAFGLLPPQAKELAREVLGVPKGVDIKTWMDEVAKTTAQETTQSIAEIPGYTEVTVAVTEDGTVGEVQSKVNGVTGKTEYIFVTDDGTSQVVQEAIVNIDGVERKVWVTDDGTVVGTQDDINGIKGKSVTVTVGAGGVDEVNRQLNWVARPREASVTVTTNRIENVTRNFFPGQGVTNPDNGPITGQFGGPRRASGGSVFGPGTETSDSIPVMLSNNEHVLSAEEVRGLGGHGAVERLRAMARDGGVLRRASGGRVSWARSVRDDAKDRRDDTYAELRRAKKSKDDKWKSRAQKAYDAAKSEYEDARDRVSRLAESEFDLRRDLKRGEIRDSFTSGSGMSVVDRLFDQSNNTDLSKRQRSNLRSTAYGMESQLLSLEKRSESLTKKLEKAVDKRDELLSAQRGVQSSMVGAFDLGGLAGQTNKWGYRERVGKRGLLSFGKDLASGAKKLKDKVSKLQKLGFGENMLNQVIEEWTSSGTFELADAMLSMNKSERGQFIGSFKSLESTGLGVGEALTRSMSRGGINAAEGLVAGLESQQDKVDSAFYKLGKSAEKSFKKSLGIKSPSRVMFGAGVNVGEGAELGILSKVSDVQTAAEQLMNPAAFTNPSLEVARYAAAQGTPTVVIDYDKLAHAMSNIRVESPVVIDRNTSAKITQIGNQRIPQVR